MNWKSEPMLTRHFTKSYLTLSFHFTPRYFYSYSLPVYLRVQGGVQTQGPQTDVDHTLLSAMSERMSTHHLNRCLYIYPITRSFPTRVSQVQLLKECTFCSGMIWGKHTTNLEKNAIWSDISLFAVRSFGFCFLHFVRILKISKKHKNWNLPNCKSFLLLKGNQKNTAWNPLGRHIFLLDSRSV